MEEISVLVFILSGRRVNYARLQEIIHYPVFLTLADSEYGCSYVCRADERGILAIYGYGDSWLPVLYMLARPIGSESAAIFIDGCALLVSSCFGGCNKLAAYFSAPAAGNLLAQVFCPDHQAGYVTIIIISVSRPCGANTRQDYLADFAHRPTGHALRLSACNHLPT